MTLRDVEVLAAPHGLFVMGAKSGADPGTLVLLGAGPGCWPVFIRSPEYADTQPDPLDRWSKRVIGSLAATLGATDVYPSDGPPYAPFIQWALDSGRFFQSPTGMMIHDTAGLMISIRGALRFPAPLNIPKAQGQSPCVTCTEQPCVTACPVDALSSQRDYDVPTCKSFLGTLEGQDCMEQGCKVRRACPVSQEFDRASAQSAFHMTAFKG